MNCPTIHRSTVFVALAMLLPVVLLNVPGEIVSPLEGDFGPVYEYIHGWPWAGLYRSVSYDSSTRTGRTFPDTPKYGVPWLAGTSWEFWQYERQEFWPIAVAGDFAANLILIVLAAGAWEWRRRKQAHCLQFTLRELAIAMTLVAAAFGWWRHGRAEFDREESVENVGVTDISLGQVYKGPLWLKRLVGEELLHDACFRATSAYVGTSTDGDLQQVIAKLRTLPYLQRIDFSHQLIQTNKPFPFAHIKYSQVSALPNVKKLSTFAIWFDDDDIRELGQLQHLDCLYVNNIRWQDQESIRKLRSALPNCHIDSEDDNAPNGK